MQFFCSPPLGHPVDGINGYPLIDRPVAADQLDDGPGFRITDGINGCFKLAPPSAESEVLPAVDRFSFGNARVARSGNRLCVFHAHAIMDCFLLVAFDRNSERALERWIHAFVEKLSGIRNLHSEKIFRSMHPVEFMVRRLGTHRTLAPDISPIARSSVLLDFLGQRYSTSRSGFA